MRLLLILLPLMVLAPTAAAQQPANITPPTDWQQAWQQTMSIGDDDEAAAVEDYADLLQQLSEQPLDLNSATREELGMLPFLSELQVMDLIEYRSRYGPIRSMGELRTIRSLDHQQLTLLPYFTYTGQTRKEQRAPRLDSLMKHGRHMLTSALRVPFYKRKGDANGFLGYPYRHWLRYEFSSGDDLKIGFIGSQDAGEPFFTNRNTWGYDAYSYYLQLKKLGIVEQLIAGKFKLSAGMGLVAGNSFILGKSTMMQNQGRTTTAIRPHTSRSVADYFQGAAATLTLTKQLRLTLFGSCRPLDATLRGDSIATVRTDGYHRTPSEMEKKHNAWQTAAGAHIGFRTGNLQLGLTTLYTQLDRTLAPDTRTLYRKYFPQGNRFLNTGIDYACRHRRWTLSGETAIDKNGALATVNTLGYSSQQQWSLLIVQRFYSYRYATLHGHAFSEGGKVQNESGICIGATWQPLRRLFLRGYADFAYFPWARYRISQSSAAHDYLGEAVVSISRQWSVKGRYRLHLRQLDSDDKKTLRRHNEHRARVAVDFKDGEWAAGAQGDWVRADNLTADDGWMLSGNVAWKHRWWQMTAAAAWFSTDSYDSRIYTYERQLPHEFAFPMYYGKGFRMAAVARISIGKTLQLDAKIGHTHYSDRTVIGSGLQQTDGNSLTDLDLQMRWKF